MSTPAAWVVVTGATALLMPRMHFDVGCCGVVIGIHYFTILETILVHIVYVCLTSAFFRTWQSSGVHIPPMYAPTAINTARLQLKKQQKKFQNRPAEYERAIECGTFYLLAISSH